MVKAKSREVIKETVQSKQHNYARTLTRWGRTWHTPTLPKRVTITFSPRLRKSLGRVRPATGIVTLNAKLAAAPREVVLEVVCHEVAHVAAHLLHGRRAKPHGPEWRALVAAAGYEPTTKMQCRWLPQPAPAKWNARRHHYRCPSCQADYYVRRRNSRLHCAKCNRARVAVPLHFVSPS